MKIRHLNEATIYRRAYGDLQLFCGNEPGEMKTENADFKLIRINPRSETSHHYHLERESIFHIVCGRLLVKSVKAQLERELIVGDTIVAEPGEDHLFRNIGEEAALMYEIESPVHASSDKIPCASTRLDLSLSPRRVGRFWEEARRIRLKICGVKNLDTALECHRLGVDAIGIHAVRARGIAKTLGNCDWMPHVPTDLSVFLLTDTAEIGTLVELVDKTGCDTVQIQGPKTKEEVQKIVEVVRPLGRKVAKTISAHEGMPTEELTRQIEDMQELVDALLVDSALYGGTGRKHNWELILAVRDRVRVPLIIAGGIGTDDCAHLIGKLHPYGVDVESNAEIQIRLSTDKRLTAKNFEVIKKLVEICRWPINS